MDQQIQNALTKSLQAYASAEQVDGNGILTSLTGVFESDAGFLTKVDQLDAVFDDYPPFEALREIVFDLLLMNFFAADAVKLESDYLESEAWQEIEEETIDRGTELLNLLLYLRECADERIDPQLNDYLNEFLLVDQDEFQDEHQIYEPMIANQLLVESSYGEIARVAAKIPRDRELADLFYPVMGFFYEPNPTADELAEYIGGSANSSFDKAIYELLVAYSHNH